jgi:hypothetical protein
MSKQIAKPVVKQVVLEPYDVKVETMVPATLIFKVLAESPEQAVALASKKTPNSIAYFLSQRKDKLVTVYNSNSVIMRLKKVLYGLLK